MQMTIIAILSQKKKLTNQNRKNQKSQSQKVESEEESESEEGEESDESESGEEESSQNPSQNPNPESEEEEKIEKKVVKKTKKRKNTLPKYVQNDKPFINNYYAKIRKKCVNEDKNITADVSPITNLHMATAYVDTIREAFLSDLYVYKRASVTYFDTKGREKKKKEQYKFKSPNIASINFQRRRKNP